MDDPIAPIRAAVADRYAIERQIGQGAFACVYLARDLRHDRNVAVKILGTDPNSEMGELRFLREIHFLAQLQHPNILPLIDSGHVGSMLFYVMPYVSGESLRERMQRDGPLPVHEAVGIAREMADALDHAHRNGVVHRDIKPENVLLSAGHPMIADFGIARAIDRAGVLQATRTGSSAPGTPAYMSPEQLMNDGHDLDGRSDTYSLGCVLYEMLTGHVPFAGREGFVRRFRETPVPVTLMRPGLPVSLDDVILSAMAPDPDDRFPSAGILCQALAHVDAELTRRDDIVGVPDASPLQVAAQAAQSLVRAPPRLAGPHARRPDLVSRRRTRGAVIFAGGLMVLGAAVAYARRDRVVAGRRALDAGHVTEAITEFRAAVASDTASRAAALWLAQALVLAGADTTQEARRMAALVRAAASRMAPADARRAEGLGAMAAGEFDHACAAFRTLQGLRPGDVAATLSLAECHARDETVLPDSASASRWRFRGDRELAIRLYRELLVRLPPGHEARRTVFAHLPPLLTLEWGTFRSGHHGNDSSLAFGGFPALEVGDAGLAVSYAPHPLGEFRAGQPWMNPPSMERAWERDRAILRSAAAAAVAELPRSAESHLLLARALELAGDLVSRDAAVPSALTEIRAARALATAPAIELAARAGEVRLLIKTAQFALARRMADSILADAPRFGRALQAGVAPLAALTGHSALVGLLMASGSALTPKLMPDGHQFVPNPQLAASVAAFSGYASVSGPRDSLFAMKDRVERAVRSFTAPQARDSVWTALLARPLSLSVPVLGPGIMAGLLRPDPLMEAQQALARGDVASVRARLEGLRRNRAGHSAASVHVGQVYQEAWLRAAIGDTAVAVQQMDDALDGLAALGTMFLSRPEEAGALAPLMLLRATIATRAGQSEVARRWISAARALRSGGDPGTGVP